ncbi:MAG: hypothetical protein H3C62_06995 [Gemmatimonadaceae bacterium]|nr:hypothetical protein [Gemmatimonadaceae bacterium]
MMAVPVLAELVPMALPGAPAVQLAAVEPGEVMIVGIIFGSLGVVFYPLMRALGRRLEGKTAPTAPALLGVEDRLDRIERAIDAMSLEVERISEGQRFVTKLLAEKAAPSLPPPQS